MPKQAVLISLDIKRERKAHALSVLTCEIVCKPSSVFDGHLSRQYISALLKRMGGLRATFCASVLASSGVYTAPCRQFACELLPHISILTLAGGCFLLHCP